MTDNFFTKHLDLAAFLLYSRPDAFISTTKTGPYSASFEFADEDDCAALSVVFFAKDGVPVADARALLDCVRIVRQTMSEAAKSPDRVYLREAQ
jgi:hypothetical protein